MATTEVMTEIAWLRDADEALRRASTAQKMVLMDFTAAPN